MWPNVSRGYWYNLEVECFPIIVKKKQNKKNTRNDNLILAALLSATPTGSCDHLEVECFPITGRPEVFY